MFVYINNTVLDKCTASVSTEFDHIPILTLKTSELEVNIIFTVITMRHHIFTPSITSIIAIKLIEIEVSFTVLTIWDYFVIILSLTRKCDQSVFLWLIITEWNCWNTQIVVCI